MDELLKQQVVDEEHLKLLRMGYFISAGINGVFSLFGVLYGFMGTFISAIAQQAPQGTAQQPPEFVVWIFALFGFGFAVVMLALAALKLRVARCLKRRRSRLFCMVVAGVSCFGVPYGTLLGVLTFIVLGRSTVSQLFTATTPVAGPGLHLQNGA